MIISYSRDGEQCDIQNLKDKGFEINFDRDIIKNSPEEIDCNIEKCSRYNFVGFLINKDGDMHFVMPKGYRIENVNDDIKIIFSAIQKHKQKRPDRYLGNQYGEKYISNYPFAAFWGIYDYYEKFGLYYETVENIKPNISGKVNWKETLRRTNYYITGNDITFFPFFYSKKYNLNTLITDCMIFAINYTVGKFNSFLNVSDTGKDIDEYDFINNRHKIIEILKKAKTLTFKDISVQLLNNLIDFYECLNEGGVYYLKTYVFEYLWEDVMLEYLRLFFKEVKEDSLIFDEENEKKLDFKKRSFNPNLANKNHKIEPDYYCINKNVQYIFDAKYKKNINGIDYKQVCYSIFLKNKKDNEGSPALYDKTFSALLIPDEKNHSKLHFKIDPIYNDQITDLTIIEQYIDIRKLLNWYIN